KRLMPGVLKERLHRFGGEEAHKCMSIPNPFMATSGDIPFDILMRTLYDSIRSSNGTETGHPARHPGPDGAADAGDARPAARLRDRGPPGADRPGVSPAQHGNAVSGAGSPGAARSC